jgi:hypothetical protein
VHGFKRARNLVVERTFRYLRPPGLERFVADHAHLASASVAVTIAYNAPWVVELLTRMARLKLVSPLLVFDNSRSATAREEIERLCGERAVPYFALPYNPERHPCRSHGVAMNWVWYNVIRNWKTRVIGFLDHDLVPLQKVDFEALVRTQPVYGVLNQSAWGWNLWAGFSVFDVAAIDRCNPDFNNDVPRGLDTGGQNYTRVYCRLPFDQTVFADWRYEWIRDPAGSSVVPVNLVDSWLHVGGAGFGDERQSKGSPDFYRRLVRYVEEGGALSDLVSAAPR